VKLSTLDRAIAKARGDKGDGHAQGQTTILPEHEPWPEPVALDAILNDLARAIRRHVILSVEAADVIALWAAHTWVFETFDYTPRLSIRSPARQCGKSTLLGVLKQICRRPVSADSISAASTFRIVEDLTPLTLLLDETDTFLKENEELRGVVNSGFAHDGGVIRTVEINRDHKPRRFRTFAPMVLAGIGNLPATIEDRAVPVTLHRKASGETVTKLREPGARVRLHDIGRRLARWAADNAADLNHVPTIPEALGDREGDISVVLLAIAEAAGGKWPTRARDALLAVFERRQAEEGNAEIGALLLGDILAIFRETGSHRIASTELCKKLAELEERPWPEWRAGKPITPSQLATLLRPFLVKPGTHRMPGGTLAKGYQRDHFNDVWKRYLGDDAPASAAPHASGEVQPVTPSQAQNSAIFDHPTPVTGVAYPDGAVTAPGGVEMVKNCDSYPVAAENTPMRDNDEGTVL
jgi:putative DNA primase/helicase